MRLSVDQMKERYTPEVFKAIMELSEYSRSNRDPITVALCKRFRAWLQKHESLISDGRQPLVCKEWLKNPSAAIEHLTHNAAVMGVTYDTVDQWRIHRKNLSKPFSNVNHMFIREVTK